MARPQTGGPLEQAAAEAVRHYLDALKAGRPEASRRQRSAIERRLAEIEAARRNASPMLELRLLQERHDLEELHRWFATETAFVDVARAYSRRHGITYATWLEIGVPAAVLHKAGLRPRRSKGSTPEAIP